MITVLVPHLRDIQNSRNSHRWFRRWCPWCTSTQIFTFCTQRPRKGCHKLNTSKGQKITRICCCFWVVLVQSTSRVSATSYLSQTRNSHLEILWQCLTVSNRIFCQKVDPSKQSDLFTVLWCDVKWPFPGLCVQLWNIWVVEHHGHHRRNQCCDLREFCTSSRYRTNTVSSVDSMHKEWFRLV